MSAESTPIWSRTQASFPPLQPLAAVPPPADVVVIGAGIAGLSVALALLEEGHRVLILEKHAIGAGQTRRTSAHLASALDDRFHDLERWHGAAGARHAAQSHRDAIDRIERWVARYDIRCDFRRIDGYLLGEGASDPDEMEREFEAASRAGLEVERIDAVPELALGPALRFAHQARFDPIAYIAGIAQAITGLGGIFVQGEAIAVEGGDEPIVRTTQDISLRARAVVVATNVPFHESFAIHTKQAAYRTYVIGAPIERSAFPDLLLWDMGDPYHYVRRVDEMDGDASWLIVGGADHKTGQSPAESPYPPLMEWAQRRFPSMGSPGWQWSGQIIEPVDGLGFIGRDPGGEENVYIVTGDSGNGLTHGTIAAEVIARLVGGHGDPWDGLYDPQRKPYRAIGTWLAENTNVAAQYRDWVLAGIARPLDVLDGTVVRHGVHRIAVSRTANGQLHAFSAQCPHLGCSVRWNASECTWDCPCHGSRFDPVDGSVINGPASRPLDPVDGAGE